jgi:choline dehydrogenase-like flavoprotein
VNKIIYDEQKQKATGIQIIDTETKREETFHAKLIFLNASSVATAFILLHSTSNCFPNGLGNGSGQVGQNLMDHHRD